MCINKDGMARSQAGSIVSPLGLFLDFKAESESLVTQQCLRILVTCIQTGLSHGVSVFPLPVLTRSQGGNHYNISEVLIQFYFSSGGGRTWVSPLNTSAMNLHV